VVDVAAPLLLRINPRPWILPLALVTLWAIVSAARPANGPVLFVSPAAFLSAVRDDTASGALPGAVLATLARTLAGFSIGSLAGLFVGLLVGLWRGPGLVIGPTIDSLRQVALFAWIPLLSAWLGNGEAMKVTLISLGAFFPVALAAAAAGTHVPKPYLEVGDSLELDRCTVIRRIILPAGASEIAAGLELSLNVAWLGTIGAEYLIGTGYINGMGDGVGAYLAAAREYARMDQVLAGIVTLALVGLALDRSVAALSRRLFPWQVR
jgi:sulfonate transport system permease protein